MTEALQSMFIGERDTDTHKVCGCCDRVKPVAEFYRDGKDKSGKTRYRRDCMVCYKNTRLQELKLKNKKGGVKCGSSKR